MEAIGSLFGGGSKPQGPSAAEIAVQRDQQKQAATSYAEADDQAAMAGRLSSLRKSLSYSDKKRTLGG